MLTKINFAGECLSFVKSLIDHKLHQHLFFSYAGEGGITDGDCDLGVFTSKFKQSFGSF